MIIMNISFVKLEFNNNSNIISLRFKTYYPYSNYSRYDIPVFYIDDFYESIYSSKLYLQLEEGDENNFKEKKNQTLNVIVDSREIIFLTTDIYFEKYIKENNYQLCHFNTSKSSTFYEHSNYYKLDNIKSLSSYAKDSFKIYTDISLSKYSIEIINFVNTINHNISTICGNIGLSYLRSESVSYNFIAQLHRKFNLSEYSFVFNYTNDDEGIFILGNMPHNYLQEKYSIDNLVYIYSINMKEPMINIKEIIMERNGYTMEIYDQNLKIKINTDIEGFEFPEKYFIKIEEIIFNNYYNNNICHKEVYKRIYEIVWCESGETKFNEKEIKSFPNITFYLEKINNFSLCFNGNDLFYYKDNKYFFKIVSNALGDNINLGRVLLKKYLTVFNQDKKQIYFYKNIEKNKENKENKETINNQNNVGKFAIIISCIICAVIFFILGIYFGHKIWKKRNKKAYELNDEYDYTAAQDNNDAINSY